jgi:hypothetical protein
MGVPPIVIAPWVSAEFVGGRSKFPATIATSPVVALNPVPAVTDPDTDGLLSRLIVIVAALSPDVFIFDPPATVTVAPVAVPASSPTRVVIPPPPGALFVIVIEPAPGVIVMPVPAVREANTGSAPVDPIGICPLVATPRELIEFVALPNNNA